MISLCITTYNRTELLFESFAQVLNDDRISEIVIVDDHSDIKVFDEVAAHLRIDLLGEGAGKIKLYRNEKNLGCYRNKREAVSKASNEWVILLDSDNVITPDYLNALPNVLNKTELVQPTFARPNFDFRRYEGHIIKSSNVAQYADLSTFTTALNAMNYFVNRDEYLRVWEDRPEPWTADSLLQNYNWLKAGNSIYFCPGLEYEHRIPTGKDSHVSHYQEHHKKTGNLYNELVNKLKAMR